jgi:hypothetical protein
VAQLDRALDGRIINGHMPPGFIPPGASRPKMGRASSSNGALNCRNASRLGMSIKKHGRGTEHSKPLKPIQERVLKVSKVPNVSISEKFSPRLAAGLNAKNQENLLPHELPKLIKVGFEGFEGDQASRFSGIDRPPDPDEAEIEERKGMAADTVPEAYLDAGPAAMPAATGSG